MMKVKTKINYKAIIICHYFFAFIIIYLFNISFSHSKIEISINDGISEALPIAISEFNGDNLDSIEFGAKIKEVLVNDKELKRAKEYINGSNQMNKNDSSSLAAHYGYNIMYYCY